MNTKILKLPPSSSTFSRNDHNNSQDLLIAANIPTTDTSDSPVIAIPTSESPVDNTSYTHNPANFSISSACSEYNQSQDEQSNIHPEDGTEQIIPTLAHAAKKKSSNPSFVHKPLPPSSVISRSLSKASSSLDSKASKKSLSK